MLPELEVWETVDSVAEEVPGLVVEYMLELEVVEGTLELDVAEYSLELGELL